MEDKMKTCLSSDVRLMQDLPAIKKLAELKKQYEETLERYGKITTDFTKTTQSMGVRQRQC